MNRLMIRQRTRLASFGWTFTEVKGRKVKCSLCMQAIERGDMAWNRGYSYGRFHNRCMAGLFIYGPRVLESVQPQKGER